MSLSLQYNKELNAIVTLKELRWTTIILEQSHIPNRQKQFLKDQVCKCKLRDA